jgi:HD superfamily phosphohydrolase
MGNPFELHQEIYLPVHGKVEYVLPEIAVIDHPALQRLRRVRQLGLAHNVFPGGTHSRFEHSIGAVHVAQRMIDAANRNHAKSKEQAGSWRLVVISPEVTFLIRLGALLHDVGHVPLGHTLEDELGHLSKHDGHHRLGRVADTKYRSYVLPPEIVVENPPADGWTLRELIDSLYGELVKKLGLKDSAFDVVSAIITKPAKEAKAKAKDEQRNERIDKQIPLKVCQDVVGNTICADFLDYLHRDWHHLGKPLFDDQRLYDYMEARGSERPDPEKGKIVRREFVINVGQPKKVRHDALTSILDLLEARYRLAETVLFHRTKLALIGLLDRCLLEIFELHRQVGIAEKDSKSLAEELLLAASDDDVPRVLSDLARGGATQARKTIDQALESESKAGSAALGEKKELFPPPETALPVVGPLQERLSFIDDLISRFSGRKVYTLAHKLRMSDFPEPHNPDNSKIRKIVSLYHQPGNRLQFLTAVEALCRLPRGSVVMYCPHDARMNAKIAKVNLLVDDDVIEFDKYESRNPQAGLTCGALGAQVGRFYQLWSTQVFVEQESWQALTPSEQLHLEAVLREFLFQLSSTPASVVRVQMEGSLKVVRERELSAARSGSADPTDQNFEDFTFPSGLTYSST